MGILNRLLLVLYAASVLLLAAGTMILCTGYVPMGFVQTNLVYLCARWETAAAAAVFLLVSLRFLALALQRGTVTKKRHEAILVHGAVGDVQVAIEAIRSLVEKTVRGIHGVRDVKVQITVEEPQRKEETAQAGQKVAVTIKLVIGNESNVVGISDQARELVTNGLRGMIGLESFDVEVVIDDISNAPLQKQRVV